MKQTPITINDEQELDTYTVNFTGDYATVTVTVNAIRRRRANTSRKPNKRLLRLGYHKMASRNKQTPMIRTNTTDALTTTCRSCL
jgi:hypothetical protein